MLCILIHLLKLLQVLEIPDIVMVVVALASPYMGVVQALSYTLGYLLVRKLDPT